MRFDPNSKKTSTSNKWVARVLPKRFRNLRNTNQKSDTWNTIDDMWINYK